MTILERTKPDGTGMIEEERVGSPGWRGSSLVVGGAVITAAWVAGTSRRVRSDSKALARLTPEPRDMQSRKT